MNIYLLIILRLAHVVAGILWGGAAIAYLFFVKPSVESIGAAGPDFMRSLMERRKYPIFMMAVSLVTALSGALLYWALGRLNLLWIKTGPGLGFTLGSLAALVAFFVGGLGIGPASARLAALGGAIAASGGTATPRQASEMRLLAERLVRAERIDFIMLAIAMLTMATARYWVF
ncbi:MAG: hypothetical protein ACM3QS_00465 [Bacteroidota bacterium]